MTPCAEKPGCGWDATSPRAEKPGCGGLARFSRLVSDRWRPRRAAFLLLGVASLGLGGCGPPAVGSIGAVLGRDRETGALHVRETPDGHAAEQAGLVPGDQIKMIDGVLVDELTAEQVRARLRGEVGTAVKLTIIRGSEVLHVELARRPLGASRPAAAPEERIEP